MTDAGGIRSANADMSSDNGGEKPPRRSPRFPVQRSSEQGESAPKARQRCVADGKQVNIPVPMYSAMWGRILIGHPGVGYPGLIGCRRTLGKSGVHIPRPMIEPACW